MALETLKEIKQMNGFKVMREADRPLKEGGVVDWVEYDKMRAQRPIMITESENMISFKIQKGPVKENGVNGCQVDELVTAALLMVKGLNAQFPCEENVKVLENLYSAQLWLWQRKLDRENRGVEGSSKA